MMIASIYKRALWRFYFFEIDKLMDEHYRRNPGKQNAVILASFPKSGNTFFRFVWLNAISLSELGGKEVDFELLHEELPFDGYFMDIKKDWNFKTLPCLLKTHCAFSVRYKGFRTIHLFRNPLDTMVSFYHYLSKRAGPPQVDGFTWIEKKIFDMPGPGFKGTFSEFLRNNFDAYCRHFRSWCVSGAIPASYEAISGNDRTDEIDKIMVKLGINIDRSILDEAIKLSQKERLKDKPMSKNMAKLEGMHFIRDGSVGQWKKYYSIDDIDYISSRLTAYGLGSAEAFPVEYKPLLIDWPIGQSVSIIKDAISRNT